MFRSFAKIAPLRSRTRASNQTPEHSAYVHSASTSKWIAWPLSAWHEAMFGTPVICGTVDARSFSQRFCDQRLSESFWNWAPGGEEATTKMPNRHVYGSTSSVGGRYRPGTVPFVVSFVAMIFIVGIPFYLPASALRLAPLLSPPVGVVSSSDSTKLLRHHRLRQVKRSHETMAQRRCAYS